MTEPEVFEAVIEAASRGEAAVLATVVRTRGSVPRHAGSRMLVGADGRLVGTIGGGCGEADVARAAAEVAASGVPRLVRIALTDPIDSWSPAVCGGVMEVFLEPVRPRNE
jgi:xanthine dehydrogenase accessory factor